MKYLNLKFDIFEIFIAREKNITAKKGKQFPVCSSRNVFQTINAFTRKKNSFSRRANKQRYDGRNVTERKRAITSKFIQMPIKSKRKKSFAFFLSHNFSFGIYVVSSNEHDFVRHMFNQLQKKEEKNHSKSPFLIYFWVKLKILTFDF